VLHHACTVWQHRTVTLWYGRTNRVVEIATGTAERHRARPRTDEGDESMSKKNPHWGPTLDDFLREEGIRDTARAEAVTRVVAWQLAQEMKRKGMSKTQLAELMHTSRAQVDRILGARGNVTIETLQRAVSLVGREPRIEMV
jgi:DNA-binding phage protein